MTEGQDLAELKREIAQLIDPDAWRIGDQYPDRPKLRQYCRERSLAKADAILARASDKTHRLELTNEDLRDQLEEAEATITRLQADLARAVEALGPFAHEPIPAETPDSAPIMAVMTPLWVSDFRRASEVFTSLSEKGE